MAANHGNTPAAWTAVAVAMLGFLVGSVGMLNDPVNMTLLWIGLILGAVAFPLFLIMAKLGFHASSH